MNHVRVPLMHDEHELPHLLLEHLSFRSRPNFTLTAEMVQRSLVSIGSVRMQALARRLSRGDNVSVVAVGGSTAMGLLVPSAKGGMKHTTPSSARFAMWLSARYPQSQIRYRNHAVAGTTSEWRALEVDGLKRAKPDLVLWDYSSNDLADFGDEGSGTAPGTHELRAGLERLARALLQLPSKPAVIYMASMRNVSAAESKTYHMQTDAAEPVVRRYGLGMVSFRDAIWPSIDDTSRSHLFEVIPHSVHVSPWTHQLITDCLCYFWSTIDALAYRYRVELDSNSPSVDSIGTSAPVPEAVFLRASSDVLAPCEGGWKTLLRFHRNSPEETQTPPHDAHEVGDGWSYTTTRPTKEGWEFDALHVGNRSRAALVSERAEHVSGADLTRLHKPIAFKMRFGPQPRLVISYLRSYANYGRALVWFDDDAPEAIRRVHVNECHSAKCLEWFAPKALQTKLMPTRAWCGDDPRAFAYYGWRNITDGAKIQSAMSDAEWRVYSMVLTDLRFSTACQRVLAGKQPPFVLDGWWTDHSSQTHSEGFGHGFALEHDPGARRAGLFEEHASVPLIPSRVSGDMATSSEHIVRLAMLTTPSVLSTMQGVGPLERIRFKVTALRSC